MKIAVFMVVKNDEFYVDMAIKSVLPYVIGVYVQDQMSDDGTYEKVKALAEESGKIHISRVDTGEGRFSNDYDEAYWRTMAVEQCEEIFKPDWILKIDGDEIFTSHFFGGLAELERNGSLAGINAVRVAGDRFISKTRRSVHPSSFESAPDGTIFVDPHTQLWRAGRGVKYINNPAYTRFHPVLDPDPYPQYWMSGICNIHLHRTFGPKALAFWQEGGDPPMQGPPYHPPTQADRWYNSSINLGNSQEVNFEWPSYVMDKWNAWGVWE